MRAFTRSSSQVHAGESGQTIVELAVAMAILGVVVTAFVGVLSSVQTALVREETRSATVDQARLAIEAIDREVRSGNVLYDPANATPTAYYGMRVYTQSNGTARCVQYQVQSQSLLRRSWLSGSGTATAWRTVATGIVNSGSGATVRPFQLDTSTAAGYGSTLGSRVVNVTFIVNAKPGDVASRDVRLVSSIAIRNQTSGDPCTPVPAG